MPPEIHHHPKALWKPLDRPGCHGVEVRSFPKMGGVWLAMLRFQPGGTIDEHSAEIDIDVFCLEGSGMTSVGGEQAAIQVGEWVHWPAGVAHKLWAEEQPMVTLMVEHVGEGY